MTGALGQVIMLMGITTGFRALARWAGPRRSGLILGLPSTTVVALLGCAVERGTAEATAAAEICLAGLVAAAALPLTYGRALRIGLRAPAAAGAGVAGYVGLAGALWWLPRLGPAGCALLALLGVLLACRLGAFPDDRRRPRTGAAPVPPGPGGPGKGYVAVTRVGVPLTYVLTLRSLRALAGPEWSGRFITFPGASLALLVATHVEAGPGAAVRLASALPAGSLATLAFLTVFRFGCPQVGLVWGTVCGYLAAVSVLLAVETFPAWSSALGRRLAVAATPGRQALATWAGRLRVDAALSSSVRLGEVGLRYRDARRFAPGLEALAG